MLHEQKLSVLNTTKLELMSEKTLANWMLRTRLEQLTDLRETQQPLTELEAEVSRRQHDMA